MTATVIDFNARKADAEARRKAAEEAQRPKPVDVLEVHRRTMTAMYQTLSSQGIDTRSLKGLMLLSEMLKDVLYEGTGQSNMSAGLISDEVVQPKK